jgi:hypothetical protein
MQSARVTGSKWERIESIRFEDVDDQSYRHAATGKELKDDVRFDKVLRVVRASALRSN